VLLLLEDPLRRIPEADPSGAETLISLGACLANLVLAACCEGWRSSVELVDDRHAVTRIPGELDAHNSYMRPVALIRWQRGDAVPPPGPQPLALSVFVDGEQAGRAEAGREPMPLLTRLIHERLFDRRRSERSPYGPDRVPPDALNRAISSATSVLGLVPHEALALYVTTNQDRRRQAQDLLFRSLLRAFRAPRIAREAAAWFRPSRETACRRGDGEPLDAFGYRGIELWLARRALSRMWGPLMMRYGGAWRIAKLSSASVSMSPSLIAWAAPSGAGSPWETRPGRDLCFLSVGCAIEAAWLSLTGDGIGLQFMTPCLLFPDSRREVAEIFGMEVGHEPLTLQRIGYPRKPSEEQAIRLPLSDLLEVTLGEEYAAAFAPPRTRVDNPEAWESKRAGD
jgi:hypothetical protein